MLSTVKLTRPCPARWILFAIVRLESAPFRPPRLQLCGWRGPFELPSISPACVFPGQRAALSKRTKGSSNLSLTIANTTPIWAKPSLTIENDRVPWTWPRAYLTFGAPDFRNSGSNPDDPKTDVKREPYGSPTFNCLGQRDSRVRFANALPLPRKLGRANSKNVPLARFLNGIPPLGFESRRPEDRCKKGAVRLPYI